MLTGCNGKLIKYALAIISQRDIRSWPPIAGAQSGSGGASNQSINNRCSPREQHNLMRHTHTHAPLFDFLISAFSSSSSWIPFFLSFSCFYPPSWTVLHYGLCTALSINTLLFSALLSNPAPPWTSPKFQGEGTHKSKECSWAGVEEEGGVRRWWTRGWGSWDEGQAGWWCKEDPRQSVLTSQIIT